MQSLTFQTGSLVSNSTSQVQTQQIECLQKEDVHMWVLFHDSFHDHANDITLSEGATGVCQLFGLLSFPVFCYLL